MASNLPFVARVAAESPAFGEAVERIHEVAYTPGELDVKTKLLISLALDIAFGESRGAEVLGMRARAEGATTRELTEVLEVCFTVMGSQALAIGVAALAGTPAPVS
jgi:alkylhydroperoxidase/carboxymuconolactone decarboxylase family protein YurZ